MTATVIQFAELTRGIIRRGVPVETNDGRLGFVRDWDFAFDAEGRMYLAGYEIQLTDGRGALAKAPDKVKPVTLTRAGIGKQAVQSETTKPGRGPDQPSPKGAA